MQFHQLKLKPEYLQDVFLCDKKAELRKNDRDFQVGDLIHFVDVDGKEFDHHTKSFFRITYVYHGTGEYGLAEGYCILSIERLH